MPQDYVKFATRRCLAGFAASLLLAALPAEAQIYKCEGDNGTIAYSQTPCPDKPSTEIAAAASSSSGEDCGHANRFALHTARAMRAGTGSDQLFARYGGLDSMSRGSIGLINYVYQFRTNDDVSVERIASLSEAKCRAGSLGDVSCEALPMTYTDTLGGCDAEAADGEPGTAAAESNRESDAPAAGTSGDRDAAAPVSAETPAALPVATRDPGGSAGGVDAYRACREPIERQIEAIDEKMRRGYDSEQGEAYRERLRALTKQLRACKR